MKILYTPPDNSVCDICKSRGKVMPMTAREWARVTFVQRFKDNYGHGYCKVCGGWVGFTMQEMANAISYFNRIDDTPRRQNKFASWWNRRMDKLRARIPVQNARRKPIDLRYF